MKQIYNTPIVEILQWKQDVLMASGDFIDEEYDNVFEFDWN